LYFYFIFKESASPIQMKIIRSYRIEPTKSLLNFT
jgi:hypothetical protein